MRKGLLLAVVLGFMFVGLGCSNNSNKQSNDGSQSKQDSVSANSESQGSEQAKSGEMIPITLYFSDKQTGKLIPEKRNVPKEALLNNVEETIINELIKGPTSKDMIATVPQGTKLLTIKNEDGRVIVNLSKEFIENHPGGSAAETLTIYSIVNSLTELKEVESVKFLIEGQEKQEYKGHYQFNIPFTRYEDIINRS